MGFLRLFKTPKNQQFSYKPRYWDPKKEEAEKLRQRVEQLQTANGNGGSYYPLPNYKLPTNFRTLARAENYH